MPNARRQNMQEPEIKGALIRGFLGARRDIDCKGQTSSASYSMIQLLK